MSYELTGILHKVYPTESKSEKFQAREFVVKTISEQYEQFIKFQLTQDKCDIVDNYNEGQKIKVHFDLRGREWKEKYFTNLNAWRLEAVNGQATDPVDPKEGAYIKGEIDEAGKPIPAVNDDDLPF